MIRLRTFITVVALAFVVSPNQSFSQETKTILQKEGRYVILSPEKFAEIKAEMEKQDDWSPILIEGFPKNELVAFYIQSYADSTILTWVDYAYNKIHSSENTKPDAHQERKMQKSKLLPRTKENMHGFMMIMTTEQIEVVGF
jgi:hypothetical protein